MSHSAGITEEFCVCVGEKSVAPVEILNSSSAGYTALPVVETTVGTEKHCSMQYHGRFLGIAFQSLLNNLHYVSAATVSFARGLNDTQYLRYWCNRQNSQQQRDIQNRFFMDSNVTRRCNIKCFVLFHPSVLLI